LLSRFARYVEKGWDFPALVQQVRDTRPAAQIPASSVFLSAFGLFAMRLPSLNAMEQELKIPARWEPWVGPTKPSADTLAYSLARFDLEGLRDNLARIAHQAKRKKSLHRLSSTPTPYWGAALDGHELWASFHRCCDQCLTRWIETAQGPTLQYYHRVVLLQMVDTSPALVLDIEPILPGEGEVAAAMRILKRLRHRYPRFIDFITTDALYLQAPFVQAVRKEGLHVIIVLKQENRELYQDVDGLLAVTPPTTLNANGTSTWQWDLKNLTTWTQLPGPIRVVRTVEEKYKRRRTADQWIDHWDTVEWRWATTFSASTVPGDWIARWGHARWDIENRGFNELSQHWAMDHCFHHHPTAIIAILLILAMAFALTTFFFDRNLKPAVRQGKTRLHLASLLADDLRTVIPRSFWSQPP
jgi:hypothetical protein